MAGRALCVSFYRPQDITTAEKQAPWLMLDNGAFSFWKQALRAGKEFDETERDWQPYYNWVDQRLWMPGRWAVIPDRPGAPSQLNDGLLNDWPFGRSRGAPLWHMDGPLSRLGRLCERYDRVCLGWVGEPGNKAEAEVGCDAYRRRMDEVSALFGNHWPVIHMMRGVAVAYDYPFQSADSTSLAQNGWRYDSWIDRSLGDPWSGRRTYADWLEGKGHELRRRRFRGSVSGDTAGRKADKPEGALSDLGLFWP